jgi:hypothetical protein
MRARKSYRQLCSKLYRLPGHRNSDRCTIKSMRLRTPDLHSRVRGWHGEGGESAGASGNGDLSHARDNGRSPRCLARYNGGRGRFARRDTMLQAFPGFHYYWFVLNAVEINDPASETYFGYGKETSGNELPLGVWAPGTLEVAGTPRSAARVGANNVSASNATAAIARSSFTLHSPCS